MEFKSYNVVSEVLDEASKRFSPLFKQNDDKRKGIQKICEMIDNIVEPFDGESFDIEVDEENKNICMSLECHDVTIDSKTHPLYGVIGCSCSFQVSHKDSDTMILQFTFPSIWDAAM